MARPREFDLNDTLDRAMQAFWAKGYEATSLDDLCAATGLGRSSLYAAFGDKQGLYLNALAQYEAAAVARINAAASGSASPRAGITAFVHRVIDDIVAGPGRRGCFIGNCAGELARHDKVVASRVRESMARVQNTFRDVLLQAKGAGQLGKNADVDALAAFLMSGIQGLRLVGKANPDRAVLTNIANVMLRCLDQ
ncbi:MAG: TetR family transcriptional regulator C-terminal domain-containing protein [Burkholderiales bacterium]